MITRWTVLVLALGGCAAAQTPVTIPEPGRVVWEQCHADVVRWCAQHGHAQADSTCEQDRANEYAGLITDQARREYLSTHGCPI